MGNPALTQLAMVPAFCVHALMEGSYSQKVNPDLVARDEQGKPYTVRYEAVNAMLLNEFLKEHKAFVLEQDTVASRKAVVAQQQKQIDAPTGTLQKVSAQLELSKTAP
jgi:hypothetical protein